MDRSSRASLRFGKLRTSCKIIEHAVAHTHKDSAKMEQLNTEVEPDRLIKQPQPLRTPLDRVLKHFDIFSEPTPTGVLPNNAQQ